MVQSFPVFSSSLQPFLDIFSHFQPGLAISRYLVAMLSNFKKFTSIFGRFKELLGVSRHFHGLLAVFFSQSGVAIWGRFCYQRGLPRLAPINFEHQPSQAIYSSLPAISTPFQPAIFSHFQKVLANSSNFQLFIDNSINFQPFPAIASPCQHFLLIFSNFQPTPS